MKHLVAILVVFSFASITVQAQAAELKPGDPAPDFKLQASDGKTYSLKDFAGKKAVVVAWYPKAQRAAAPLSVSR